MDMTKVKITMSLDEVLINRIDKERGLIPRSRYVERKLILLDKEAGKK